MSSETNAPEAEERRWKGKEQGWGGKERVNGEKGRERASEISICRGWQNGSRRHELPRHVEFVTALFALRVRRKKEEERSWLSKRGVVVDAHTHTHARTHVYAHASMVASIGWLPLRRVETSLHRFRVEAARSLDFYSISFHLSPLPPPRSSLSRRLPPSPSRFPFHAIDFPFAKRKNVSSATPIHRPGGEELNFAGWISRWNDDLRVQIRLRRLQ